VLGSGSGDLAAAVANAGGKLVKRLPGVDAVIAEGSASFKLKAAGQRGVRSVVPNLVIDWLPGEKANSEAISEAVDPPNNPPGTIDSLFNLQWGHTAVQAVAAWNAGNRGNGARVAVLDTGFSLNHPDIAGQFDPACTADMTGEGLAYGPNSDDPTGIFSHGMHTAGTVAAAQNNIGTIGVAPEAELCLVKVLLNSGSGSFADVVSGIIFAADKDVDIISMSLGGYLVKSGEKGLYTASDAAELRHFIDRGVSYATKQGALVIAAAGNDAIDFDKSSNLIHTPADSPGVLSISATAPIGWGIDATRSLDNLASYSNFGQSAISLAGPGGDFRPDLVTGNCTVSGVTRACPVFDLVISTGGVVGNNAFYFFAAGTSMATPHVSGVAALIVSRYGSMPPSQLRSLLERGADDLGKPGNDSAYGAGRVNAAKSTE
jgi:subtilisin family serine protease